MLQRTSKVVGICPRVVFLSVCFACLTLLGSALLAQTPGFAQLLYGMWYTYPLGNPNTDSVRHEFRHNSATGRDEMIVTRLCPGDYRAVIARAVSPIEVTETTIRVLKTVIDKEKGEHDSICLADVQAGVYTYIISPDKDRVSLANPGGMPDMIELARQDAASESLLPSNLYGTWLAPLQQNQNVKIQVRLVFYSSGDSKRGKVRQIMVCSKGNDTLVAQVDANITVAKDQITILDSETNEKDDGPFTCTATITSGTLHYVVAPNGATITLNKPGERAVVLTRERQDLN